MGASENHSSVKTRVLVSEFAVFYGIFPCMAAATSISALQWYCKLCKKTLSLHTRKRHLTTWGHLTRVNHEARVSLTAFNDGGPGAVYPTTAAGACP